MSRSCTKNKRIKKVKWSKTAFLHRAGVRSPDTHVAHKLEEKKKRLSGTEALALSTPGLIADWRQLHRRVALKAGDTRTGINHSSLSQGRNTHIEQNRVTQVFHKCSESVCIHQYIRQIFFFFSNFGHFLKEILRQIIQEQCRAVYGKSEVT